VGYNYRIGEKMPMNMETKVTALVTTGAMIISVLTILIGFGIGWGILQTKISTLEARADVIGMDLGSCQSTKLEKEVYYKDQERLYSSLREMREDIKEILKISKKTTH